MNKQEKSYNALLRDATIEFIKTEKKNQQEAIARMIKDSYKEDKILWQQQLLVRMKFYISYLGLLDALLMKEQKKQHVSLSTTEQQQNQNTKDYNKYLNRRHKLLRQLKAEAEELEQGEEYFPREVLYSIPASDKFDLLYTQIKKDNTELKLVSQFIRFYTIGFLQEGFVDAEYIAKQFEKYSAKMQVYKKNNQQKLELVKIRSQVKKH